jgi:hypothetical protein
VQGYEARQIVRNAARAYEQALDPAQRKQFGQFFTGVPLGKLLAHLALQPDTRTVLDPMAGHGDLLDATSEAAAERDISLDRLDGIEIHKATAATCRDRLAALIAKGQAPGYTILAADAFDPQAVNTLPARSYDLVITNPPYVRYQARNGNGTKADATRSGLEQIVVSHDTGTDCTIWKVLAQSYSGLADLSVPAWILAGSMVRPGGRLALVVPATWRSRDYADAIRYLLLRCFALETIVADTQPGWFSDALVRTHLIIARRLTDAEAREPLAARECWPAARWLHVAPEAANDRSLVGTAFEGEHPEADFAARLRDERTDAPRGIEVRDFDLRHEWAALQSRIRRQRWYRTLEGGSHDLPLFSGAHEPAPLALPERLRDMLPHSADAARLVTLEEAGIRVGQGLRTGCNGFFYVTACGPTEDGRVRVKASSALGGMAFLVPSSALRPVLRRQSEIALFERGEVPPGRVLDLRAWVLPEDAVLLAHAKAAYALRGDSPPKIMPADLAEFVRRAATLSLDGSGDHKRIPDLSAVRTNVREPRSNRTTPRFWYMLPDFAPRHLPAVFAPRINQGTPWLECNTDPPLLIDANFSTFWVPDGGWPRFALKALLNSVWCRAFMEAAGTPLGGGALKLEATHLRQMPVPLLTKDARPALEAAGKSLTRDAEDIRAQIDHIVLQALLPDKTAKTTLSDLAEHMAVRTSTLCSARQRAAS